MRTIFEVETPRVSLTWRAINAKTSTQIGSFEYPGRLRLIGRSKEFRVVRVWRSDVPEGLATAEEIEIGPQFYEQTDYQVVVRSNSANRVALTNRDPVICNGLSEYEDGKQVFGVINFRSDVGLSTFTVLIDGNPEFDFEIEVFPSKLDYKDDYERLVAETQGFVAGLVFEYLRSTYRLSFPNLPKQSGLSEWLLLLKSILAELEQALNHVTHQPKRQIEHKVETTHISRIRQLTPQVRKAIVTGNGGGAILNLSSGLQVRERLPSRKTGQTLDTSEHRWLALQLQRIRDTLQGLLSLEIEKSEKGLRSDAIVREIRSFIQRVLILQKLEPIIASGGMPPSGFASLQLLTAPGYREAYRACNLLSLGLQIEGGPVGLSLKSLSTLYEHWCFLTVVYTVADILGVPIPASNLIKSKKSGLEILLAKGRESEVCFKLDGQRKVTVAYNRHFSGLAVLTPQQPDILITVDNPNWPSVNLILDAKYRVKLDDKYCEQFGTAGPPIDAVNALHRYRDAILDSVAVGGSLKPKRTIVQAAALFPYSALSVEFSQKSKLWQSIDSLGIGAIPLLPGTTVYLRTWLTSVLQQGGWSIADRTIGYSSQDHSNDWRHAAREHVLVAVLRQDLARAHFDWLVSSRTYYMPFMQGSTRQLSAKWVAVYIPPPLRNAGAVAFCAPVLNIELKARAGIATPWRASHSSDSLQVVYTLGPVEPLPRAIVNSKGERFSSHRWSSKLALERAKNLAELMLESEQEWRLYETLVASMVKFSLDPIPPKLSSGEAIASRVWFVLPSQTRLRTAGVHGFVVRDAHGNELVTSDCTAFI